MGFKGVGDGITAILLRLLPNALEDTLVPQMNPVEIPEGEYGIFEGSPKISSFPDDFHSDSISLDKAKINLPTLQAGGFHLNLYSIPQSEESVAVPPHQGVFCFPVLITVLREPGQVDQPFDEKVFELHKDPKGKNPGDIAVIFLTQFISHELHFFAIHDLPLGLHGDPFSQGRMLGNLGKLLLPALYAPFRHLPVPEDFFEDPVNH
jgi:hypothetical protein